jgi:hypothetical protein
MANEERVKDAIERGMRIGLPRWMAEIWASRIDWEQHDRDREYTRRALREAFGDDWKEAFGG